MDAYLSAVRRKRVKPWMWGLAIGVAALLAAWGFRGETAASDFSPITVQEGPLTDAVALNAILTPSRVGAVSAVRGGQVVEVVAYPGQQVKAGDVLLRLSNPDLEQQLAEVMGEKATAGAELASLRAEAVDQANALALDRTRAQSEAKVATMQMEAEAKLQREGIVSMLQLNRTRAEVEGKLAASRYADQHMVQAQVSGQAKIAAASERLSLLVERADSLRQSVDNLTLRAPFDGVVAKIDGKAGGTVAPGTQMAEVITKELHVEIQVAEQFANKVRAGMPIVLEGGTRGSLMSLAPSSDGGVVKGRAQLTGDTSHLRSNASLPGEIVLSEHGKGLFVVLPGQDMAHQRVRVKALNAQGEPEDRQVQFGDRLGHKLVVKQGLAKGEQIVGMERGAPR